MRDYKAEVDRFLEARADSSLTVPESKFAALALAPIHGVKELAPVVVILTVSTFRQFLHGRSFLESMNFGGRVVDKVLAPTGRTLLNPLCLPWSSA